MTGVTRHVINPQWVTVGGTEEKVLALTLSGPHESETVVFSQEAIIELNDLMRAAVSDMKLDTSTPACHTTSVGRLKQGRK